MALNWGTLKKAEDTSPPFSIFYGGAKMGKTSLASEFPDPYYCRTGEGERAPIGAEMVSFGVSESYEDVIAQMDWMLSDEGNNGQCRTFVCDALDGLEQHIYAEACARNGWASIEEPGFGKGYIEAHSIWMEFRNRCLDLKSAGFFVVLIAHVKTKTVPGVTTESYPRYMLNLRDDAASLLVDASDLIAFLHQRVSVAKEESGFNKKNKRGQGAGDVLLAVQERPGFVAGNRYDIPKATLDFKPGKGFAVLSQYFPGGAVAANDNDDTDEDAAEAA